MAIMMMLKQSNRIKAAAADYLQRDWSPIRLKPRSKEPRPGNKHSSNTITWANIETLGDNENLGVQFSEQGKLKDLDPDYQCAAELVRELRLHEATAAFGRSAGIRHLLYNAPGAKAKKFELPEGDYPRPLPMHDGEPSRLVVEIRGSDNTYTMFPPSVHPETGETIDWHGDRRDPAEMSGGDLRAMAGRLAFAASVLHFYPLDATARYDVRMALTGALARSGMPPGDVTEYMQAVARLADDPKWREDFAERTAQRLADDEPVTGVPKLVQVLQLPQACVHTFHEWLGSSDELILDPADPIRSARRFTAENFTSGDGQPTLYRHRGAFWSYTGSYFRLTNDETIKASIWTFLEKAKRRIKVDEEWQVVPFKPTRERVGNVLEALGAIRQLDSIIEPPAWLTPIEMPPANEFFACGNGLLHLPSGKLYPATPDYFNLSASDVAFDRHAAQPKKFLDFLKQLWGDDQQSIILLQDWHGYSLSPDTSQQKICLMVGPKRSGKGTIARILKGLLGTASVAGPTMSSLADTFGLEPLITKPLAIISDARIGARTDKSAITERLLSISGEDQMTVARKFKSAWDGQLMTRFMIITNDLPSMSDNSGALAGRYMILLLIKSFFGKEDPALTGKLLKELPGILNWAIAGYRRLHKRGHFVQPKSSQEAADEIEMLAAPVKAFIRDRCQSVPG